MVVNVIIVTMIIMRLNIFLIILVMKLNEFPQVHFVVTFRSINL